MGGDSEQIHRSYTLLPVFWPEKGRRVPALAPGTHSRALSSSGNAPTRARSPDRAEGLGAWGEPTDLGAGILSGQLRCAGVSRVPPTSEQESREPSSRPPTHRPTNRPTSGPTGSGRVWSPRDGGGDPREARSAAPASPPPHLPPGPPLCHAPSLLAPWLPAGTRPPRVLAPQGPASSTRRLRTCLAPAHPAPAPAPPPRPSLPFPPPSPASLRRPRPSQEPRSALGHLPLQHPSGPGVSPGGSQLPVPGLVQPFSTAPWP